MTGSLRINVSGLQGEKTLGGGTEVDIPYIEDTSATKPKVRTFIPADPSIIVLSSTRAREWC